MGAPSSHSRRIRLVALSGWSEASKTILWICLLQRPFTPLLRLSRFDLVVIHCEASPFLTPAVEKLDLGPLQQCAAYDWVDGQPFDRLLPSGP
jgi:hypothetical protein